MNRQQEEVTQRRCPRSQQLSDLLFTQSELRSLRRQGTVCGESRRGANVFKLRFRTEDGRQRVRYIGSDPNVADVIRRELQELQRHRYQLANLKRQCAAARKLMRDVKEDSQDALAQIGFHYHGFAIRKCNHLAKVREVDSPSGQLTRTRTIF